MKKDVSLTLYKNWGTGGKIFCETGVRDVSKKDNVTWSTRSLGDCKGKDPKNPFNFDISEGKIKFNFNLDNLTDPSCPEILPKVLTIKFRNPNGTGSIVYSNSHKMNNWLNPKKGEDYGTAIKLKGK